MSIVSAFCPTPPSTSRSRSHRTHRTQNTDPHNRTHKIQKCAISQYSGVDVLIVVAQIGLSHHLQPFAMCLINPYIILREWQTNIKELSLQQGIALLLQCFPALIAFVRMWKCSGGRAGDHERTMRPKWGQLPTRWSKYSVQDQDHNIQNQCTRPIYKTNIQDQDQDQDHERTIRPKWNQLPGLVQILCPRPQFTQRS